MSSHASHRMTHTVMYGVLSMCNFSAFHIPLLSHIVVTCGTYAYFIELYIEDKPFFFLFLPSPFPQVVTRIRAYKKLERKCENIIICYRSVHNIHIKHKTLAHVYTQPYRFFYFFHYGYNSVPAPAEYLLVTLVPNICYTCEEMPYLCCLCLHSYSPVKDD